MTKIAFLGLGAMGSRMAGNLIAAGHDLTVWNRTAARTEPLVAQGAKAAATPREAAAGAELVFAMVRDDEASRQVWFDPATGAAAGMAKDAIGLSSSTLSLEGARAYVAGMAERGLTGLDAPVLGSRPQAEAKALIFVVGGDEAALRKAEPVMHATANAVHWAGEAGAGAAVKLAVNTLLAIQVTGIAELIGFLRRNGLDLARAMEIVAATPTISPNAKFNMELMLQHDYAPRFTVELIEKDMTYSVAASGSPDKAPLAEAARRVFRQAIDAGFGGENLTAVAKLYA